MRSVFEGTSLHACHRGWGKGLKGETALQVGFSFGLHACLR